MESTYRGCKISSKREKALGGWSDVYWHAYSADGYCIDEGFGGGTVKEMYDCMKGKVDEFLDDFNGDSEKHSDNYDELYLKMARARS